MSAIDLFSLSGKVALVTGGGRGLGEQMSLALAQAGADVALCSRRVNNCEEVASKIEALGRKALALGCDVSNPDQVKATVSAVIERFGKIDILINNSGATWGATVEDMPLEAWNKVINTNALGTFLMCQQVGKHMVSRKYGKIINIASVAAYRSMGMAIGYTASKGAIVSMTTDLASTWAPYNITVNAIAPGFFPTKMSQGTLEFAGDYVLQKIPMQRYGSETDLQGATVFLASDASAYVTGVVIPVDGGMMTR